MEVREEMPKGGWGWLVLPFLLMVAVSQLIWLFFMVRLGDPAAAGRQVLRIGPFYWSALQLILLWVAIRQLKKLNRPLSSLIGWSFENLKKDFPLILSLAVGGVAIIIVSLNLIGAWKGRVMPFSGVALIWWTVAGSITAGIGEEVYFRGFLLERLKWMKPSWQIILTSLAFGLWHVNPVMFLHTFLIGAIFAGVYLRKRRLLPLIVAHILIDATGGLFMLL